MRVKSIEERFWAKVDKSGECWIWMASTNGPGYGQMSRGHGETRLLTHRVSWELHYGSIPAGLWVLHHCDTPRCVRPEHLFLGTVKDNAVDMMQKRRGVKAGRPLRGERQGRAKLNDEKVRTIREAFIHGETRKGLAARFGVSAVLIGLVINRRNWTHVA